MSLREALEDAGISDQRLLDAFEAVPRWRFLPETEEEYADEDVALSIGAGHMSPQPSVLARLLELAEVAPGERVLEIGAGRGYLTAVLEALDARVIAIEREPKLAKRAARRVDSPVHAADGFAGWPADAPYDLIVATAAVAEVPDAWLAQLAPGGRIVAPIGARHQRLTRLDADGHRREDLAVDFASLQRR
ncbi:MAG: protein-L-isoaspartate O-methyltransferase [Deltaproteobacteria bacterium]|nr:MAG: protein-L-isoaspartate O-methyltransferase [Deltaproteobacteria bacterium]